MTQRTSPLALPPLQQRTSLPRIDPAQKAVSALPDKVRRAECISRPAADLNSCKRWVAGDLREEVQCRLRSGARCDWCGDGGRAEGREVGGEYRRTERREGCECPANDH